REVLLGLRREEELLALLVVGQKGRDLGLKAFVERADEGHARLEAELVGAALRLRDLLGPRGGLRAEIERSAALRERDDEHAPLRLDPADVGERDLEALVAAEQEVVRLEEDLPRDFGLLPEAHRGHRFAAHPEAPYSVTRPNG